MSQPAERKPDQKPAVPSVPRDPDAGAYSAARSHSPGAAVDANPRDEEIHADREKPLVADSREARQLHEHPPRTKGELDVGTAGDAARPVKPGIHGKPLPPRGDLQPRG